MAAPAAPHIIAHGNGAGERVLIRWQPIPTATDYNLYVTEGGVRGLEDSINWTEVGTDGWLRAYTSILAGTITVDVTSLNAGAEESAASNAKQVILRGGDPVFPDGSALQHVKGL